MTKGGPRVLILEPSGNLWGSERVLLDFLRQAINSEWEIAVCCPPNTPIIEPLSRLDIRIFPAFSVNLHLKSRTRRRFVLLRLLFVAARFQTQLLYVNQGGATRMALFVGRLLRIPVITHVRLVEDVEYIKALRADSRGLPKIICISKFVLNLFDAKNDRKQIEMMYDPYSPTNNWSDDPATTAPNDRLTICCVGRLTAVKGQDVLLQAVALLKSQGVHVRALMVGAAPPHDRFGAELRDLADALGISALISWLGYQEDVLTCVRGCHVQVCPSHSEPLGRVVFEAWDAGILPIAWRDSGGSAEVIQSSGGGLLYDEQSGEGLAKVLRLALDMNIEVRREMIERGRAWLTTNCDPQVFADSMFAVWHDTLESQPN